MNDYFISSCRDPTGERETDPVESSETEEKLPTSGVCYLLTIYQCLYESSLTSLTISYSGFKVVLNNDSLEVKEGHMWLCNVGVQDSR